MSTYYKISDGNGDCIARIELMSGLNARIVRTALEKEFPGIEVEPIEALTKFDTLEDLVTFMKKRWSE